MIVRFLWAKGNDKSPITRCKLSFFDLFKDIVSTDADLPTMP
jgi:hypothetical protein